MCLGTPSRIEVLHADLPELATVTCDGQRRSVNIGLLDPGSLAVGDWVLVHLGFAVTRMDPADAEAALAFRAEASDSVVSWGGPGG